MILTHKQLSPCKAQMRESRALRTLIADTNWLVDLNRRVGGSTMIEGRIDANSAIITQLFHGTDKYNQPIGRN